MSFLETHFPRSDLNDTFFPPANKFDPSKSLPDLSGKVFIVTGANTGIGKETVKQLLLKNAKVYLGARDESKAKGAIEWLKGETEGRGRVVFLKLDLGNLASIKRTAEEFLKEESKLDVLINNAGVMLPPTDQLTSDGYDLQFGTNVLGHYYLTKLLVPALLAASDASGEPSRVINLSSSGHKYNFPNSGFIESTLVGGPERDAELKKWFGVAFKLYGQSKFGNMAITHIFKNSHPGKIISNSVHPGGLKTDLQRHVSGTGKVKAVMESLMDLLLFPAAMGAINSLYSVVAPPEEINGQYVIPWARIGITSKQAENPAAFDEMRAWMDKQILNHSG